MCVQCGAGADLQCTGCQTGMQVYCGRCAVEHIKKGGAHTLLRIDIPISCPEDAVHYNSRFRQISQLQGTLDIAEQVITTEEGNLQNQLNQQLHMQIQTLQSAYSQVESDLKAYYIGLKREVERMRTDLAGCLTSISAPSGDTEAFMLKSAHLAPSNEPLLRDLISRLPSITCIPAPISSGNEFIRLCEAWGGRQCNCTDCTNLQNTLFQIGGRTTRRATSTPVQQIHTSIPRETWTCRTCSQVNPVHTSICYQCRTANNAGKSQWTCLKCYTANPTEATACVKCHLRPGLVNYLLKMGVIMSPDRTKWKCAKCSNLVLLTCVQCNNCCSSNSVLADALSRS